MRFSGRKYHNNSFDVFIIRPHRLLVVIYSSSSHQLRRTPSPSSQTSSSHKLRHTPSPYSVVVVVLHVVTIISVVSSCCSANDVPWVYFLCPGFMHCGIETGKSTSRSIDQSISQLSETACSGQHLDAFSYSLSIELIYYFYIISMA